MDTHAIARKIRDAIFEQADIDGRVLHGDSMDRVIESVLAKCLTAPARDLVANDFGAAVAAFEEWNAEEGARP